jgi:hypothetical protein
MRMRCLCRCVDASSLSLPRPLPPHILPSLFFSHLANQFLHRRTPKSCSKTPATPQRAPSSSETVRSSQETDRRVDAFLFSFLSGLSPEVKEAD